MVTRVSSVDNTADHLESFIPQILVKHQKQQWVHKGVNKANVKGHLGILFEIHWSLYGYN